MNLSEIRLHFDSQKPSQGLFSKRTRKDIEVERDKAITPWEKVKNALDMQIDSMKRTLLLIDKQAAEQMKDKK